MEQLTPEEKELRLKLAELETLQIELSGAELELNTLKIELKLFEGHYIRETGPAYVRLDNLKADLAAVIAAYRTDDNVTKAMVRDLEERVRSTKQSQKRSEKEKVLPTKFDASPELKKLYRDAVKLIHPDLADSNAGKQLGHRLMIELNDAFARNDIDQIKRIMDKWRSESRALKEIGIGGELVRVIRKIANARDRIAMVADEMQELISSAIYQLWLSAAKDEDAFNKLSSKINGKVERLLDDVTRVLTE